MPAKKLNESPFIKYIVSDAPGFEKFNEKYLPIVIEALNDIHINLSVSEEGELSLFIPASYYNEYHKRNAGRRRTSSSKAFAVIAMIGTVLESGLSNFLMVLVASRPSISGILTSISIAS